MTADEALAAIKRGEPIHVDADEIDRFMALLDARSVTRQYTTGRGRAS